MSDADLIDEIERIRDMNNIPWVDLANLGKRVAPQETEIIIAQIFETWRVYVEDDLIKAWNNVRPKVNRLTMNLLRLVIARAPDEAKAILRNIARHDRQVISLTEQLGRMP